MIWRGLFFSARNSLFQTEVPQSFIDSTVMILINAITSMPKSTLSTNNFGNNHFGEKYQKQNILGIFRKL